MSNATTAAPEIEAPSDLDAFKANMDSFFLIINGFIIFFMQGGFAFLEAGSVRSVIYSTIAYFEDVFAGKLNNARLSWKLNFRVLK